MRPGKTNIGFKETSSTQGRDWRLRGGQKPASKHSEEAMVQEQLPHRRPKRKSATLQTPAVPGSHLGELPPQRQAEAVGRCQYFW